jgi:hypothetical protein
VPYRTLCKMRRVTSPHYWNFLHGRENFCPTDGACANRSRRSGASDGIRASRLFETEVLFPYALLLLCLGFGVDLVAGMTYHLMFDPSAVDVVTRLDLLSIDRDKWTPRS